MYNNDWARSVVENSVKLWTRPQLVRDQFRDIVFKDTLLDPIPELENALKWTLMVSAGNKQAGRDWNEFKRIASVTHPNLWFHKELVVRVAFRGHYHGRWVQGDIF